MYLKKRDEFEAAESSKVPFFVGLLLTGASEDVKLYEETERRLNLVR